MQIANQEMVDVYELYDKVHDNNVMLSFKGDITFDLVRSVLDIIEAKLEQVEDNPKTKKKVFNVLVECLQNLCHHVEVGDIDATIGDHSNKVASLLIWKDEGAYYVATGNYLPAKHVEKLKSWLEKINANSKEELRLLYKEILNNNSFTEKGGGGLGFIDIARKSGRKLNFDFKTLDERFSFFSFQINIPKE